MTTPEFIVKFLVQVGRDLDRRFPDLRARDADDWINRVAVLANLRESLSVYGRKSRGPGARVSPDTVGIRLSAQADDREPFYAVSLIRDDPANGNPWRDRAEDHGLVTGQLWIAPEPVDVGEGPDPEPPPGPGPGPAPDDVLGELRAIRQLLERGLTVTLTGRTWFT